MFRRDFIQLIALAGLLQGCATLPTQQGPRAVYVDLRKAVELSEDTGWVVDRIQLEANLEGAMRSVCQSPEGTYSALTAWLQARIDDEGGPAKLQYLDNGGDLGELGEVLTLERVQGLLAEAHRNADTCPFWLTPDPQFQGVEGNAGQTSLWLESQGYGAILLEGKEQALSGGGGARLLVARGLSAHLTLAAGLEAGGSGALDPTDTEASIDTAIHVALPVVARVFHFSRAFDFEVAPVVRFDEERDPFPPGFRATVGAGLTTMRKGAFMPHVILWLGYEGHGLVSNDPISHSLRIGTRVGFDWNPGVK